MLIKDVLDYKFTDGNFIKDYQKTMKILDEVHKNSLKKSKID